MGFRLEGRLITPSPRLWRSCAAVGSNSARRHAIYGPPDLVVEVLSSATRRIDREYEFVEYAQAGISEHWMPDLDAQTVEVFVLDEGVYVLLGKFDAGQVTHSSLLEGFQVEVDQVFAR